VASSVISPMAIPIITHRPLLISFFFVQPNTLQDRAGSRRERAIEERQRERLAGLSILLLLLLQPQRAQAGDRPLQRDQHSTVCRAAKMQAGVHRGLIGLDCHP
jgi:hypothetical protein